MSRGGSFMVHLLESFRGRELCGLSFGPPDCFNGLLTIKMRGHSGEARRVVPEVGHKRAHGFDLVLRALARPGVATLTHGSVFDSTVQRGVVARHLLQRNDTPLRIAVEMHSAHQGRTSGFILMSSATMRSASRSIRSASMTSSMRRVSGA